MARAWCCALSLLAGLVLALPAAASPTAPEEGFDYEVRQRAPGWPEVPGKITVIEAFWYQCPQCHALLPLIENWARGDARRIHFMRLPLTVRPGYEDQEVLYHALEELGVAERLHAAIFEAIHVDRVPLKTLQEMAEFLEWHGIPSRTLIKVARSPAVKARVAAARSLLTHYRISSVPVLVVDGRYLTSATDIGGTHAESLLVAEALLRLVEEQRKAAGKPN